jgi:hypothetical protein
VSGASRDLDLHYRTITVIPTKVGTHADLAAPCSQLSMGTGLRRYDGF